MLHITLSREQRSDPATDDLGRDRYGFSETMSPLALYDANHGCWKLGERAHRERYCILSFAGVVQQAIEITSIDVAPKRSDRSVINGHILQAGHPVYDTYVGKLSPVQGMRNPITYFEGAVEGVACRCGCGANVQGRDFLTGHDQTALHDRVKRIGTVAQFLDWFDDMSRPLVASAAAD